MDASNGTSNVDDHAAQDAVATCAGYRQPGEERLPTTIIFTGGDADEAPGLAVGDPDRHGAPTPASSATSGAVSSHARSSTDAFAEHMPDVPQDCIMHIVDASAIEERAMTFDRAGAYPGAINLYREAAGVLSQARSLCPDSHPDALVIQTHVQEVLTRATYLQSLGVQPAEIPLERHIHGVQLTMGLCTKGMRTSIAAGALGGVAGLTLLGPITGLAMAAGVAYATTRHNKVGNAARAAGEAAISAVDTAKALDEKHRIGEQLDKRLHISETAQVVDDRLHISEHARRASEKARAIDEQYTLSQRASVILENTRSLVQHVDDNYDISGNAEAVITNTQQALHEIDLKYKVTDTLSDGLNQVTSSLSKWVTSKFVGSGGSPCGVS